jgi:hypothetical protein
VLLEEISEFVAWVLEPEMLEELFPVFIAGIFSSVVLSFALLDESPPQAASPNVEIIAIMGMCFFFLGCSWFD